MTGPARLRRALGRWGLTVRAELPATYAAAWRVTGPGGERLVLKLLDDDPHSLLEPAGLRAFQDHGGVRARDWEPGLRALLLDDVEPGTSLAASGLPERRVTEVVCGSLRRLWAAPLGRLPGGPRLGAAARERPAVVTARVAGLGRELVPPAVLDAALQVLAHWPDPVEPVLVHGDLHEGNLLWDRRAGWTAVDPKAGIGHREMDVAARLRNPWRETSDVDLLGARISRGLAVMGPELGIDVDLARRWLLGQSCDLAVWYETVGRPADADYLAAVATAAALTRVAP